jgi:hypothetical protein
MREYTGEEIHRMVARFHTGIGDTMFQDMRLYLASEVEAKRTNDKEEIENYRNEAGRLIAEYSVEIARLRKALVNIQVAVTTALGMDEELYLGFLRGIGDKAREALEGK